MARPSPYTPEFHADAVALVVNSTPPRSIADVALQLGLNRETLRSWVRRTETETETEAASVAAGRPTAAEREELKALRRRVKVQEEEKEILRKATQFFCARDESLSSRFRFVSEHSSPDLPAEQWHPVTRLCQAVGIEGGSFYTWRSAEHSAYRSSFHRVSTARAVSRCSTNLATARRCRTRSASAAVGRRNR